MVVVAPGVNRRLIINAQVHPQLTCTVVVIDVVVRGIMKLKLKSTNSITCL